MKYRCQEVMKYLPNSYEMRFMKYCCQGVMKSLPRSYEMKLSGSYEIITWQLKHRPWQAMKYRAGKE